MANKVGLVTGISVLSLLTALSFVPRTPQEASVLHEGKLEIPQTYGVDLEVGKVPARGEPFDVVDVWFEAVTGTERYLAPVHGAVMALMSGEKAEYASCASASFSRQRINLNDLKAGSVLCVKTRRGLLSEIRFEHMLEDNPTPPHLPIMTITFTTWSKNR